jgi:CspA family cold shock protein
MTYLGTPWIESRVPYAIARKILATCQPSGLVCRGCRARAASPAQKRSIGRFCVMAGGIRLANGSCFGRPCFTAHVGSQLTAWENLEDCMPTGKIKMFDEGRGFGFIKPDDGGVDVFFHVSALQDGDEITQGKAVKFEIGVDPKSGKTKAVSVDLT